jgi:molybdopterin synthase catalytic subunit
VQPPPDSARWIALTDAPLPIGALYDWAVLPQCGAVVLFSGTVRDHAVEGDQRRDGVTHLEYEAYDEQVLSRFEAIDDELRRRWPDTGRVAIIHRVGRMELTESSVVVVVSAPHRPVAFDAARFAIDAVKASAPIWKHETWADGSGWGTGAHDITDPSDVATAVDAESN